LGPKRVTDLIEARHYLEVLLAGLAAERRQDREIGEMQRCVARMKHTSDPNEFVAADIAFHYAVRTTPRPCSPTVASL
jgi:GntR family transcriptional regulator, transcriptional repressor for pyruvate dehydrogenase complex